ncbi:MAG: hypothetical protein U5K99_09255 [Anaerolineales bacterium]|nr:hypothetical protein [Anaerolineales bacterium]
MSDLLPDQGGKFLLLMIVFLFVISACRLPFVTPESTPSSPRKSPEAAATNPDDGAEDEKRCERLGYPCSFAETEPEILERSLQVMDLAEQAFLDGGNMAAATERLQEENDLTELLFDERGIYYRVQGGPPLIFLHPEAFQDPGSEQSRKTPSSGSPGMLSPFRPEPDGPIGTNPPGEKVRKQALFVVPIAWQYGSDVHAGVEPLLRDTRDYQCPDCIQVLAGESHAKNQITGDQNAAGPSLEQFQGWEAYDLIHVYAHGYQFCPGKSVTTSGKPVVSGDREQLPENTGGVFEGTEVTEGECVTLLQTGHYQTRGELTRSPREVPGVAWTHKPGSEVWAEVVTTDFFKTQYPDGLDDKVIYFSSCQTMRDRSLADSLMGTNTAVLGWTDSVYSSRGEASAVQFFTELIKNGLRASTAYQKTQSSSSHTEHREDWHGAQLKLVTSEEGDPRGREVVTLMHPSRREELKDGQFTVTYGMPEDGDQDQLYVAAQIDGIDQDQQPEEFVVHVRLNGQELEQTFTADKDLQVGEYSYLAQGSVRLPYDVTNTEQVRLEAWAELPEGGDTRHTLEEIRPVGCGWQGSLSGVISGEYQGLIMDQQALLDSVESGSFNEMLEAVNMGGMPSVGNLDVPLGKTWVITFPPEEGLVGSLMTEMGIGTIGDTQGVQSGTLGYNTEALNYQESEVTEHQITGSFSGSYYGVKFVDNKIQRTAGPEFQGEFIFHDQALCNLEIILAINTHYAEGMETFQ